MGSISQKTGSAPVRMNADAVVTNVNDGRMNSSSGPRPMSRDAISRAPVQLCVKRTLVAPRWSSNHSWQRFVKGPFPAKWPISKTLAKYSFSRPAMKGRLKGINDLRVKGSHFRVTQ